MSNNFVITSAIKFAVSSFRLLHPIKVIALYPYAMATSNTFKTKAGAKRIKLAFSAILTTAFFTFLSFEFLLAHADASLYVNEVKSARDARIEPADTKCDAPAEDTGATCKISKASYKYADDFERKDAATLGNDWLDCHSTTPGNFEPLGIYDNGVVISKPFTRPGEYYLDAWKQDSEKEVAKALEQGLILPGIGCAFRDTGSTTISVKTIWSGHIGLNHKPPITHVEGTPLLYVSPQHSRFGFGAWTTEIFNSTIVFAGYIGSPPEKFEVVAVAQLPENQISGTPREIELRAETQGMVTVWIDGVQVDFKDGVGLEPIKVDPKMTTSTLHGFAVDAHFVYPTANIPITKSIESITLESLK